MNMANEPPTSRIYRGKRWHGSSLEEDRGWKKTVTIATLAALGVLIAELAILLFTWKDIVNWIVFHY